MGERRSWRMKRRGPKTAADEDCGKRQPGCCQADKAEHADRDDGSDRDERSWPPAIRQVTEPTWATDAASWKSIVRVPAAASVRPSLGMRSGSIGA